MKILPAMFLVFLTSLLTSSLQAAWILPTQEKLICTTDINSYGVSSSCGCPEEGRYNDKIGRCVKGDAYPIMVSGSLRSKDAVAKNLVYLDTQFGRFQLIVKKSELLKLQGANGLYFEVEGEFLLLDQKPVILVDRLSWLD